MSKQYVLVVNTNTNTQYFTLSEFYILPVLEETTKNVSDLTAQQVYAEIRKIIDAAYQKTRELLVEYKHELDALALGLMEYETLSGDEIKDLLEGKEIRIQTQKEVVKSRATVPSVGEVSDEVQENVDISSLLETNEKETVSPKKKNLKDKK